MLTSDILPYLWILEAKPIYKTLTYAQMTKNRLYGKGNIKLYVCKIFSRSNKHCDQVSFQFSIF